MKNPTARLARLAGVAVLLGALGCARVSGWAMTNHRSRNGAAPTPLPRTAAVSASAAKSAPRSSDKGQARMPLGLPGIFFRAARATGLDATAEAAIVRLDAQLRVAYEQPNTAIANFNSDLAAAIRARSLDISQLLADQSAFGQSLHALTEAQGRTFQALHDVLSDAQRRSVVEAVRASMARSEQATLPFRQRQAARQQPDAGARVARRLQQMKEQLRLDRDQEQRVASILSALEPARPLDQAAKRDEAAKVQMHDLLSAFESPYFDLSKLDLSPVGDDPVRALDQQIQLITKVVPLLRPDQLQRLATVVDPVRSQSRTL